MAVIIIYDAKPIDEVQLSAGLANTDHFWEYDPRPLDMSSVRRDAEVISVWASSNVTRELIEAMPKLRLIATRSTGYDHIDLEAAHQHDVTVVSVPSYGENTVAEYAFAMLLAVTRRLVPTISGTALGTYDASHNVGVDLFGKTFGVVGFGHIGKHAARIAAGFGMHVLVHDPSVDQASLGDSGAELASFEDMLGRSDVVSLHIPMTSSNYHLINEHTIASMKAGAILVNTARGELVENRALISALRSGHLSGAALDTIEGEKYLDRNFAAETVLNNATAPIAYEHATENFVLLHTPNVVITKHTAFNTAEAIARINSTTAKNIVDFWYGNVENKVEPIHDSGRLVIVRHSASAWNELGKWTGTRDVHVTKAGLEQAAKMGEQLAGVAFDYAYISEQQRTKETFDAIVRANGQDKLPYEATAALNERDYGVYTGMEKHAVEEAIGKKEYDTLRRSWDGIIEGGESLEQVYQRTIPFYLRVILPRLRHGQNILLVAHGNSIRSLVKYIENISDNEIGATEMIQSVALDYQVDNEGRARSKNVIGLDNIIRTDAP